MILTCHEKIKIKFLTKKIILFKINLKKNRKEFLKKKEKKRKGGLGTRGVAGTLSRVAPSLFFT